MQAQLEAAARQRAQLASGQQRGLQEDLELTEAAATLERIIEEQQGVGLAERQAARGPQQLDLQGPSHPKKVLLTIPNPRRRPARNKETTAVGGKKRIRAQIAAVPTFDSLPPQSTNSNISTFTSLTASAPLVDPSSPTLFSHPTIPNEAPSFPPAPPIDPSISSAPNPPGTASAFSFSDFMFFELFFDLVIAPSIERSQISLPSHNFPFTNQVLFDPLAAAFPANPPATLARMRIALFKYLLMHQFLTLLQNSAPSTTHEPHTDHLFACFFQAAQALGLAFT